MKDGILTKEDFLKPKKGEYKKSSIPLKEHEGFCRLFMEFFPSSKVIAVKAELKKVVEKK